MSQDQFSMFAHAITVLLASTGQKEFISTDHAEDLAKHWADEDLNLAVGHTLEGRLHVVMVDQKEMLASKTVIA